MDRPCLTIDRGNSTLDVMWHSEPGVRQRVDPSDEATTRQLLAAHPARVAAALTVVDDGLALAERILAEVGCQVLRAGRELICPLDVAYSDPAELGVDRWVGAFAAFELYGAAVVVDCGTALTLNLVDGEGVFRGGAIAPGPVVMADALHRSAPRLPRVDLDGDFELPAAAPQASVDAGVGLGFAGMVDALVDGLVRAAALPDPVVVLTGGGARYLRHSRRTFRHEPDLIHRGLRWLVERRSSNS